MEWPGETPSAESEWENMELAQSCYQGWPGRSQLKDADKDQAQLGNRSVNPVPASFCLLVCGGGCVPLLFVRLKDDPGFDSDNLGFTTVYTYKYIWPGEL